MEGAKEEKGNVRAKIYSFYIVFVKRHYLNVWVQK